MSNSFKGRAALNAIPNYQYFFHNHGLTVPGLDIGVKGVYAKLIRRTKVIDNPLHAVVLVVKHQRRGDIPKRKETSLAPCSYSTLNEWIEAAICKSYEFAKELSVIDGIDQDFERAIEWARTPQAVSIVLKSIEEKVKEKELSYKQINFDLPYSLNESGCTKFIKLEQSTNHYKLRVDFRDKLNGSKHSRVNTIISGKDLKVTAALYSSIIMKNHLNPIEFALGVYYTMLAIWTKQADLAMSPLTPSDWLRLVEVAAGGLSSELPS
ncbi:hypothetical protein [Vibrio agarivorans]|uniref:Uncharacterized protein n=1 Tax=Vibrio agarivorans TaxID=153622 RepID=A0ABT7Y705_9VIBR|nr:hypothetical protein [Vibrio agarivorans]MDN2483835.1 hypothetical protein [Vibrio agarivorans]